MVLWRLEEVRTRVQKLVEEEKENGKIKGSHKDYYVFAYHYDHDLTL